MITDEQLIARVVKKRDQRAFEQLVLRYQSAVRRWTRRLCQGDTHKADDLAQETFLKAYQALAAFRAEARFSTWLYRIAFNIAAGRWRSDLKKGVETAIDDEPEPVADPGGQLEARRDLQAAMAALSEPQQLAIRLSLEEGFSHEEIAEIMTIPLGTVKTHVLRGKKKLRELLASWQEVTP